MDHIQPLVEFYKNILADIVLRMINIMGGYHVGLPVVGLYGCVWNDGKPTHPHLLRKQQDLRMPRWHRIMLDYNNRQRLEQYRAYESQYKPTMRYITKDDKIHRTLTVRIPNPLTRPV